MTPSNLEPSSIEVGVFVCVLMFLINGLTGVAIIINTFKRKPSIDETLRKYYVSHEEFEQHVNTERDEFRRHEDEIKSIRSYNAKTTREIFDELRRMNTGFNRELQDINKAIGRIEGILEKKEN